MGKPKTQIVDLSQVTFRPTQLVELQNLGIKLTNFAAVEIKSVDFDKVNKILGLTAPAPTAPAPTIAGLKTISQANLITSSTKAKKAESITVDGVNYFIPEEVNGVKNTGGYYFTKDGEELKGPFTFFGSQISEVKSLLSFDNHLLGIVKAESYNFILAEYTNKSFVLLGKTKQIKSEIESIKGTRFINAVVGLDRLPGWSIKKENAGELVKLVPECIMYE